MAKMHSEHFSFDECACKHCGKDWTAPRLITLAEKIRSALGDRPMIPTSVCRCREHNAAVGGASDSQHMYGRAMDFYINGMSTEAIFEALKALSRCEVLPSLHGLGVYDNWVHIDCRDVPGLTVWDKRTKKK